MNQLEIGIGHTGGWKGFRSWPQTITVLVGKSIKNEASHEYEEHFSGLSCS
jgi:hypothetical protein